MKSFVVGGSVFPLPRQSGSRKLSLTSVAICLDPSVATHLCDLLPSA